MQRRAATVFILKIINSIQFLDDLQRRRARHRNHYAGSTHRRKLDPTHFHFIFCSFLFNLFVLASHVVRILRTKRNEQK